MAKKIPNSVYPNLVTISNMFFGFYATIMAFQHEYMTAFYLVIAGAVADALDGKVARYVDGASEFGVQYDTLADVVTFGFAPSAIIYNALGKPTEPYLIMLAFFPLMFGSIRLARFNAELVGFSKNAFSGMPIPAGALAILSMIPLNAYLLEKGWVSGPIWQEHMGWFLTFVAFFSLLMVSRVTYQTLPNFTLKEGKQNQIKLIVFACLVPIVFTNVRLMLFAVMLFYAVQGLLMYLMTKFKRN